MPPSGSATGIHKNPPGREPRRLQFNDSYAELLGNLDIRRLFATTARIVLDVEGNLVTFVDARNTSALKRSHVDKDVLGAVFRRDEAEAT